MQNDISGNLLECKTAASPEVERQSRVDETTIFVHHIETLMIMIIIQACLVI